MENIHGENCIGHVIRIISKKALMIDVGENDITVGDFIQVYDPSDEIFDLEGNSLGIYENIKDILKITYTSKNYSICKKITEYKETPFTNITKNTLFGFTAYSEEDDIEVESNDIEPLKIKGCDKIRKGDPVKKR